MRKWILFVLAAVLGPSLAWTRPFMVVAYNVENLFDADAQAAFEDYQPAKYGRRHVLTKVQNIARVLSRFEGGRGPDIILFQEFEADLSPGTAAPDYDAILARYAGMTIEDMLGAKFSPEIADLPAEALLAKAMADRGMAGYRIVVGENVQTGEGSRTLAQTCVTFTRFPVVEARSHPTKDARAVLEVEVKIDGARLFLFNNHWKSGASDPVTEEVRVANARTLRSRLDEILEADPNADIIIGGDFNSQYNHKQRYPKMKVTGLNDTLRSQGNELAVRGPQRDLYNLWYELPADERGSDTYRGEWGTLMQLIISRGLYDYRGVQYADNSFGVGKIQDLNVDEGGVPIRWTFSGPAGGGFSDHLPIFAKFVTVPDGRSDRYLALPVRPPETEADLSSVVKPDYSKVDLEQKALTAAMLPPEVNLRDGSHTGKIFRVDGRVGPSKRLAVEFLGDTYDVWSFDEDLRKRLRASHKTGAQFHFYGELGVYRGRWQFIIRDESWIK